jgi:NAD(P)-dependent dehydrogenase (short-subunit alcohol dehydrogenase family)
VSEQSDGQQTVALVSGASRGIGLEVARQLAQRGVHVIVTARDEAKARAAADELSGDGQVTPMALDVASEESVRALAERVEAEIGRLDVLVNNAAGYVDWSEKPSRADLDASRRLFETNLFGTWRTAQALLDLLRRSPHGRLVNVASGAGSHGAPDFGLTTNQGATASYGISKAAVNALTSKLAAELEGTGVLVNSVCPGLTATAPGMEAMGARPVPDGARSVVWAAVLDDDGPSGGFFRDGKPLPW